MKLPEDYLSRTGYRLPTETEWEFAARAGTDTAYFFGDSDSPLSSYARVRRNTNSESARPVGQLKPNPLGLFYIYGNVWEWCMDRRLEYPQSTHVKVDNEDSVLTVTNEIARTRRGGSFTYDIETARSAHRGAVNYFPDQRRDSVGFRIARTLR